MNHKLRYFTPSLLFLLLNKQLLSLKAIMYCDSSVATLEKIQKKKDYILWGERRPSLSTMLNAKCKIVSNKHISEWENFNLVRIKYKLFRLWEMIYPAGYSNINMLRQYFKHRIISSFFHLSQIWWKVQQLMLMQSPASWSFHDV